MISTCSALAQHKGQQNTNPSICNLPSSHYVGSSNSDLEPSCTTPGWKLLGEFNAAPASVQRAFLRAQRRELAKERDLADWLDEAAPDARVEIPPVRSVRWGESWRRRSRAARLAQRHSRQGIQADVFREIPAETYVERLTGEELPRSRRVSCPLPEHDDLNPACAVYGTSWHCFVCDRGGDIFDFAAAIWGLDTRKDFVAILNELQAVFA
jgi:hypothetical protein